MAKMIFVPPGGFQGFAEQTIATKSLLSRAKPTRNGTRKKRRTTKPAKRVARRAATPVQSRRKSPTKKRAHLVKGSAAAKRHMAKLRRMRKR